MVDATVDEPTIVLETLQGVNGEDLRGGAQDGRRGVNHLEEVTMIVGLVTYQNCWHFVHYD